MTRSGAPTLGLLLCLLAGCSGGSTDGETARAALAELGVGNALLITRITLTTLAKSADIDTSQGTLPNGDAWVTQASDRGEIDVEVERFSDGLDDFAVEYLLNVSLDNLHTDEDGHGIAADGDMRLFFDSTSFPYVYAARSGRRLTIRDEAATATLRDYDIASEAFLERRPDTYRRVDSIYDGSLTSSAFPGEVRFQTILPFRTDGRAATSPRQGQLEIYGAAGAVLRVTVAETDVALELDADGNGQPEHRQHTTWASLSGRD